MVELDRTDKKIIFELDRNSRQPFTQLARKLKTSKSVVAYRVRQLEKKKIIRGYYTAIDTVKIGYYNFRAYICLKEASNEERDSILEYLINSKWTWWVATASFPYDIAMMFLAKGMHRADSQFKEFLRRFKKSIKSCKVNPYVELNHFFRDYILYDEAMENRNYLTVGDENRVTLSEAEFAVLRELSSDSRQGSMVIARKLGLSPITVKSIIRRMMKNRVILAFRVLVDYSKINHGYYWIHIDVNDLEEGDRLNRYIAALPETVYLEQAIGGSDVEFGIQINEAKGVQWVVQGILDNFGEAVTDYEYFKILENKKAVYMPQE